MGPLGGGGGATAVTLCDVVVAATDEVVDEIEFVWACFLVRGGTGIERSERSDDIEGLWRFRSCTPLKI